MAVETELNLNKKLFLEDLGLEPPDSRAKFIVTVLTRLFTPKISVYGRENLEISAEYSEVTMLNHLSLADYPLYDEALRRVGRGDIADLSIPLKGVKIERNGLTDFLARGIYTIPVWPPSLIPQTGGERTQRKKINRQAFEMATKVMRKGYRLVIFPEGTRSRNGSLIEPVSTIARYLLLEEDILGHDFQKKVRVLPVAIWGTEKILPPGKFFPSVHIPSIRFGEPVEVARLIEKLDGLPKSSRYRRIMGAIMVEIARILPPEYRGIYADKV